MDDLEFVKASDMPWLEGIEGDFYCGLCYRFFPCERRLTVNTSLDHHLILVHGHNPYEGNGQATIEKDGVKEN